MVCTINSEATSALDSETEQLLQQALMEEQKRSNMSLM